MGPTRKRDLTAATVLGAVVGYMIVVLLYRYFPPIDVWTGVSLLAVAIAEAAWAFYVRAKINDGEIGDARGWLHPLAVARSVLIAKASAWVGARLVDRGTCLSFAASQHAAGGRRGHRRFGRCRGKRPRAGGCCAMASALLQVATRASGQRRRGDRVADPQRRRPNRRSGRHAR